VNVSGGVVVLSWASLPRLPEMGFLALLVPCLYRFFSLFLKLTGQIYPSQKIDLIVDFTLV
jgi:hypothetical protein